MSDPLPIKKLIDRISSGDIRIPAFQRNFVWDADQVAFLLDSIYKDFPIGTIILWKTDHRLTSEKNLGYFELPEPQKDYPVNYVLDGQQRLTSLFSVFQTELEPASDEWTDIYFDLESEPSLQESLFVALEPNEVDPHRHFPVKTLYDSVEYRKASASLSEELLLKIDQMQDKFKSYLIPNETFETDDRNKVAIVFERINRAGTELNIFELLAAWSWSDQFDLVDSFDSLQDKIAEHGFAELCEDRDLQLKVCAGIIVGTTTPQSIMDLQGDDIRKRFPEIERGILGALDFLKREAKVQHYQMLPFPGLLVPLSAFFATNKSDGANYTDKQRSTILRWFWRSIFSRRYSSDVNARQATDIENMLQLRRNEAHSFRNPAATLKIDFERSPFNQRSANSRALILLLNSLSPHSLISGATIDLDKVLKKGSKHEYHHIFPIKHLERENVPNKDIKALANICFLTRSDNNTIKDKAPSAYAAMINAKHRKQYLAEALIPENFDALAYDVFVSERARLLAEKADELMQ